MQYGKLINGEMQFVPNPIRINDTDVFTTDPTPYGYKPITYPTQPSAAGYMAVPDGWEENENEIIRKWKLVEAPDEISNDEAIDMLEGIL